jgi:hypothetical protein
MRGDGGMQRSQLLGREARPTIAFGDRDQASPVERGINGRGTLGNSCHPMVIERNQYITGELSNC